MNNKKKFAIILSNNDQYEMCKRTDLTKFKNKQLSQKKHNKCLYIKKCNKEIVKLIGVHCELKFIKIHTILQIT